MNLGTSSPGKAESGFKRGWAMAAFRCPDGDRRAGLSTCPLTVFCGPNVRE